MEGLFREIRESCSAATWSRGVELARTGAVVGQRSTDEEVVLTVDAGTGVVAPTVVLYPQDEEWSCSCRSAEGACVHVAAAAIALRQARRAGQGLPVGEGGAPAHVGYRLLGRLGPLVLRRVAVSADGERDLDGSLAAALIAGRSGAAKLTVSEADLDFERRFAQIDGTTPSPATMAKLLEALKEVEDVSLDGRKVRIGAPVAGLRLRVEEVKGGGFVARLEQDPSVAEIFDNGAVRVGDCVCAIGPHGLGEREFEQLRRGRVFDERDVAELVGQVIPTTRRHLPVQIDAPSLPGSRALAPRLQIDAQRDGVALAVLATVVYGDPPVARIDGNRLTLLVDEDVPVRDPRRERGLIERAREELGLEIGVRKQLAGGMAIELARRLGALTDLPLCLVGDDLAQFFETDPLEPRLRILDDGSFRLWFSPHEDDTAVGGVAAVGGRRADAAAVIRAWRDGEDFAPLLDGGFGRVPTEWLAKHGHLVADLVSAREAETAHRVDALSFPDLAALCEILDQPPPPDFERLRGLVDGFRGIAPATLPADLCGELRSYQRAGVDWLAFLREAGLGGLLADDMGLGKTIQALAVMRGRTLVVAPTSVISNWVAEAARFRPGLRVCVYHGAQRQLDAEAGLTITTYAILRLDIEQLAAIEWDCAVLDEAQAIKNPASKAARAAYRLQADFRVAMTGTPVENHLDDLWSQFRFLDPGLLGGLGDFQERYVRGIAEGDEQAATRLRQRLRPFMMRRLKREVARELPPRTDVVLRCELDAQERRTYDAVRVATQESVLAQLGAGGNVLAVLEALLRLRQAACHGALLPGAMGRDRKRADEASSKILLLLETLGEAVEEGHKALVFSQWTSLLDLVEPHLRHADIAFTRLDGSTRDRGRVVDEFQDPAGPAVMLLSLKAGGTGLNLTAADHVFLLDPWWNPAVEDQAADRAHRIGQDKPVFVHRLVAVDTVEERILALQERKRRLAEVAIGDASQAQQISRDELLALLD